MFNLVYLYPLYEHQEDTKKLPSLPPDVFKRSFIQEFGNNLYVEKLEIRVYLDRIDDAYRDAAGLINLIKKKYRIKD
jgi:hypothetical protein